MAKSMITFWVIIGAVVALAAYDTVAVSLWGTGATISAVMLGLAHVAPTIPFAFGYLCGHFFGSQSSEAKWQQAMQAAQQQSKESADA